MRYAHGFPDNFLETRPHLCSYLKQNMCYAILAIHYSTGINVKYKFCGENIIINNNFVAEQYVHMDYDDTRREDGYNDGAYCLYISIIIINRIFIVRINTTQQA